MDQPGNLQVIKDIQKWWVELFSLVQHGNPCRERYIKTNICTSRYALFGYTDCFGRLVRKLSFPSKVQKGPPTIAVKHAEHNNAQKSYGRIQKLYSDEDLCLTLEENYLQESS